MYQARGPLRWLMQTGQLASLLFGALAVKEYGLARFAGVTDWAAWSQSKAAQPDSREQELAPRESQGPTADETGRLLTGGVFAYSRHPLNLAPFLFFWLMPKLTLNTLVCNLLGSAYLIIGSWHEEQRLEACFGEQYQEYQRSGVPFFLPRLWK